MMSGNLDLLAPYVDGGLDRPASAASPAALRSVLPKSLATVETVATPVPLPVASTDPARPPVRNSSGIYEHYSSPKVYETLPFSELPQLRPLRLYARKDSEPSPATLE